MKNHFNICVFCFCVAVAAGVIFAYPIKTAARDFIIRNATTSAVYFKVDGTFGYVGVATSTPAYTFSVNGSGYFANAVIVGRPQADSHAATKNYVDSIVGGTTSSTSNYVLKSGDVMNGNLNMNGNNIIGVNKLTVATIDPLYEIRGRKYATYGASIVGGVKEEYVGRGLLTARISNDEVQISNKLSNDSRIENSKLYSYVIDFSKIEYGSDLWVWRNVIDFSKDNIEVFATAYGIPVPIAYIIENNKIIFNSDLQLTTYNPQPSGIKFSYRLVGKRFDWAKHPTFVPNQNEPASLMVR